MKWKTGGVVLAVCAVGACMWWVKSWGPELVFPGVGSPPEKLWEKRLQLWSTPPLTRHMRIGDPLRIDDAEQEPIEYYFQDNRLVGIETVGKRYEEMMEVTGAR